MMSKEQAGEAASSGVRHRHEGTGDGGHMTGGHIAEAGSGGQAQGG